MEIYSLPTLKFIQWQKNILMSNKFFLAKDIICFASPRNNFFINNIGYTKITLYAGSREHHRLITSLTGANDLQ